MLDFDSSNVKFAERLVAAMGSRTGKWLHEQTGIPASTLSNYRKKGLMPAADAACKIAIALGVNVYWLVLGIGEMHAGAGPITKAKQSLDVSTLAGAVTLVEDWLNNTRREMSPNKKAEIVTEIYSLMLEDTRGSTPLPQQINKLLRLVG
ncbi:helix-turn-helix domain-containing protein [Labrys sp. 22185]|uniref:helix-turn-helix domain-containing protein n=1 Tax=Labrys sp. 22185 TaxID=3453888 RepID=UPI003F82C4A6